jgi:hypothetical protein
MAPLSDPMAVSTFSIEWRPLRRCPVRRSLAIAGNSALSICF